MSNDIVVLERQLQPLAPRLAEVLGRTMPPGRLIRTIVISCERLPVLLQCDRQSLFNAAMSAACLGLEVDGVTGQAFLIPFKNRAQLVIGYKGYNTMAARSSLTVSGGVVREGDEFDYRFGEGGYVRHRPRLGAGRDRRITAAWAWAAASDRPGVPAVLDIDEILAVKARSAGARRPDSPWNDPAIGFPAMCEKTAKRRLARSLPLNVMQLGARLDEAVEEQGRYAYIDDHRGLVIENEILPPGRHDCGTPAAAALIGSSSPFPHPPKGGGHGEGDVPGQPATQLSASPSPPPGDESEIEIIAAHDAALAEAARHGLAALAEAWSQVPAAYQRALAGAKDHRHKPAAMEADAARSRTHE